MKWGTVGYVASLPHLSSLPVHCYGHRPEGAPFDFGGLAGVPMPFSDMPMPTPEGGGLDYGGFPGVPSGAGAFDTGPAILGGGGGFPVLGGAPIGVVGGQGVGGPGGGGPKGPRKNSQSPTTPNTPTAPQVPIVVTTPEPSSFALLGVPIVLLPFLRRKKPNA